jgi:hypothetical protein
MQSSGIDVAHAGSIDRFNAVGLGSVRLLTLPNRMGSSSGYQPPHNRSLEQMNRQGSGFAATATRMWARDVMPGLGCAKKWRCPRSMT